MKRLTRDLPGGADVTVGVGMRLLIASCTAPLTSARGTVRPRYSQMEASETKLTRPFDLGR